MEENVTLFIMYGIAAVIGITVVKIVLLVIL